MHEQISEVFCTDIARWNIGEESGVPLGEFVACIALRLRAVAVQNCGSTSSCLGRSIAITRLRRRQVGSFVCAKWHRYQGSVRATVISVKRHRSKSISSLAGAQLVLFGLVAPVHSLSPRNSPELTCQTIQGDRCESFPVDLTKPCEDTYLTRLNPCLRMVRADGWILPSRVCQETGHGGEFKLERRRQGEGGIYIDSFPRLISRE